MRPSPHLALSAALAVAWFASACAHSPPPSHALAPDQVQLVQRALREQGYDVPVTSVWDDTTRGALMEFQRTRYLSMTGALDAATARALRVDPDAVPPVGGAARATSEPGPAPQR